MMRKIFSLLLVALAFTSFATAADGIQWLTNYEEALKQSQASSKPIALYFTGSDWCGWCKKLDQEVFSTAEFTQEVGQKIIFVKVDFPMRDKQDSAIVTQNQALKRKYSIEGFPTLILINGKEERLGSTGYQAGGGKSYATHLQSFIK